MYLFLFTGSMYYFCTTDVTVDCHVHLHSVSMSYINENFIWRPGLQVARYLPPWFPSVIRATVLLGSCISRIVFFRYSYNRQYWSWHTLASPELAHVLTTVCHAQSPFCLDFFLPLDMGWRLGHLISWAIRTLPVRQLQWYRKDL